MSNNNPATLDSQPLVTIETVVPIPTQVLKRKFKENVQFVIDYDQSKFKGNVFMTYLTNIDTNCRIKFTSLEGKLELLKAYLNSTMVVDAPDLEELALNLLLWCRGAPHRLDFNPNKFIDENEDVIKLWIQRILSLTLYTFYAHPNTRHLVDGFPTEEEENLTGINFANLIKHDDFTFFFDDFKESELIWSPTLFTKYCFKGKNLFYYFETPKNPLFMYLLAGEQNKLSELVNAGTAVLKSPSVKGISNVSPTQLDLRGYLPSN